MMPYESSWQPEHMGKLVVLEFPSPLVSSSTVQSCAGTGLLALMGAARGTLLCSIAGSSATATVS